MRRLFIAGAAVLAWCAALPQAQPARAANATIDGAGQGGGAHGLDPLVLAGVAVILIVAKLGGELFERFKQPAVLGELVIGIVVGNLALLGFTAAEPLKSNEIISALAEIGVIILLFEVGLESNLGGMLDVGWSSLFVAVAGVVAPFFLGWGVAAYFIPDEAGLTHLFIGATLCATSVGITARVLKDMGRLQTRESRIILGAAVIDDVLGLVILAVVAGAIKSSAVGTALSLSDVALIAGKAVAFLFGAIAAGRFVTPHIFRRAGRFESRGVLLALSIAFCFLLSWAAAKMGLAPIVGAFAAGLVLDEVHFETFDERGKQDLQRLITPVSTLLVPVFFVVMGMRVDLRAFGRVGTLWFAAALTIAAIVGKQICSLAVAERGLNRPAIGLGMIPRGEVGLIFAGMGTTLVLPNAQGVASPVINAATFGAIVIMVIVTTLVAPLALKRSLARTPARVEDGSTDALREAAEGAAERAAQ
jgi:Kef-type K+ transport system membrane component KefB